MKLELLELISPSNHSETPGQIALPSVFLYKFKNVTNSKELIKLIKSQSEFFPQCCCIDSTRIISILQLRLAISKAYLNQHQNKMKTKSIYTEILLSLSPKNSILDAFKWFGLSSKSKSITVVVENECVEQLKTYIKGDVEEETEFESNMPQLEKIYGVIDGYELESHAIGSMAIQGF